MCWQQISIERLKDYKARKESLELIPEQIETLELNFTAIRAATMDESAVKGSGNKRDDALINNIAMREELKRNLEIAKREVKITESALSELTENEQIVLLKFFVNRSPKHVDILCEQLNMEKSSVYKIKDEALRRFTMACYGVVDL